MSARNIEQTKLISLAMDQRIYIAFYRSAARLSQCAVQVPLDF